MIISTIEGSGSAYTITVNTGTGNGTLGLNLVDNDSIIDATGNPLGGTGAGNGSFTGQVYTIESVTAPHATLLAADILTGGTTIYTFTVTYAGNQPIQVSTLDDFDVRVSGPNDYNQPARFVGIDINTDGTPRTATYRIGTRAARGTARPTTVATRSRCRRGRSRIRRGRLSKLVGLARSRSI